MSDGLFFEEEIDSAMLCPSSRLMRITKHPMFLVAEGYAICYGDNHVSAWARTRPVGNHWNPFFVAATGWWLGDGSITSWTRKQALDFIRADIEAHRNRPYDEDAERARLVAV